VIWDVAGGFQFSISVIGVVADSSGWLIKKRPSRETSYWTLVIATALDALSARDPRAARRRRDGDRRRHEPPVSGNEVQLLAICAPPRLRAAARRHLRFFGRVRKRHRHDLDPTRLIG